MVAVLALGGWLALEGEISLGVFLAFSTYMLALVAPVRMFASMLTVAQLARAGAERIFELLDSTPLVQEHPDAADLSPTRGEITFDDVSFGYLRAEPVLRDFSLTVRAGRDGRARRHVGLGEVDRRPAAPPLLRRARRRGAHRRRRRARRHARVAARADRRRVRGLVPLLRHDPEQHRVRPSRCERRRRGGGGSRGRGPRVRHRAARRLRDRRRRAGAHAVRRPAAAHRPGPRAAQRSPDPAARRRDVVGRRPRRGRDPPDAAPPARRPHHDPDRAPALDARARGPHRRRGPGPGRRRGHPRRACSRAAGSTATCSPARATTSRGSTSTWPTLSTWPTTSSSPRSPTPTGSRPRHGPHARRTRPAGLAPPTAGAPGGRGRGGMGGGMGGGFGGMGPALAATPELMEKVASLPPAVDEPDVDVDAQTRVDTRFRFRGFLRPFRWPLVAGLVLVTLDGLATLAGPWLIRFGINEGVAKDAQRALWAASVAFLAITLADWWVMWAQTRVMGRTSERMLFALRVKLFAHLQRLGIDYFEREMAGRVMTRMTTDIDSLSQFLQTGPRDRARQRDHAARRLGRARLHGLAARGGHLDRAAAAGRRDRLVPAELEPGLRPRASTSRRSTRTCRRGSPASASLRPTCGRAPTSRSSRPSPAAISTPGSGPRGSSRCTSRSSRCSPSSRPRSCSASAASCSPTARCRPAR